MNENAGKDSLLEFPCRFPIKMMGRPDGEFHHSALRIIERHAGGIGSADIRTVPSSAGNFVSITVTIERNKSRNNLMPSIASSARIRSVLVAL